MRETLYLRLPPAHHDAPEDAPCEFCVAPAEALQSWPVEQSALKNLAPLALGKRLVVLWPSADLRMDLLDLPVKQASKAAQAQSRIKALARMEPITAPEEAKFHRFTFPQPDQLSPPIVSLDGVSVGYGDRAVLRRLNLRLDQDDRIALLGRNGQGKSTLLKLVAGVVLHRVLALAGVAMIVWALPRLARRCGVNEVAALWLGAANPLVIFHLIAGIHNEALMLGMMLVGMEWALPELRA